MQPGLARVDRSALHLPQHPHVEREDVQQICPAAWGVKARVEGFQELGRVVLHEKISADRFHVDHAEEGATTAGADTAMSLCATLVLAFGEVEQSFVKVNCRVRQRQRHFMRENHCGSPSATSASDLVRNNFMLFTHQKLAGVQIEKLLLIGPDRRKIPF